MHEIAFVIAQALIATVEERMKDVLRNCPHYLDPQTGTVLCTIAAQRKGL